MKVFASPRLSVFPSPFNLFGSSACWRAANLFKSIRNTHMADIADQNSLCEYLLMITLSSNHLKRAMEHVLNVCLSSGLL